MITFRCRALLFDLDGTLIDSLPAVDRAWGKWAEKHGLDFEWVVARIHGRRSIDSIRDLRPEVDAEAEDAWLRGMESSDTEGVTALPGAADFVACLGDCRFAYVTSGTSDVATARLRAVGYPVPEASVYGEDILNGKPAPDPYVEGARRLAADAADCLVFEDTPAGISSARAAGMRCIGIATWKTPAELHEADAVVADFRSVRLRREGDELVVEVDPIPEDR
ncbi:MAG: HAD-IA family hydrolase [Fimbriimonas sp.]